MSPQSLTMICVAMVSLWSCAHAGLNFGLLMCNKTLLQPVANLDLDAFAGRWYKTQVSPPRRSRTDGTAIDVRTVEPLDVDNRGQALQDFLLLSSVSTSTSDFENCTAREFGLYEVIGDQLTESYYTRYSYYPHPGYYILYHTLHILATDYNTTAVVLHRPYVNGMTHMWLSEISILSRDATYGPDPNVLAEAFQGFCPDDSLFKTATSGFYTQLPNNSGLACFIDLPGEAL